MSEYNLKDHLGNNRVTFLGKNLGGGALEVLQTNDYYPFGLTMNQFENENSPSYPKNKYLYNGKEIQDDELNGKFFGMLDYGARFYDPQIGRWHSIDPMAEKAYIWSGYAYAEDSPVKNVDIGGNFVFKATTRYPNFTHMLKNIQAVLDHPNVMNNLQKYTGLSEQTIREQFKFGSGPEISIRSQWPNGLTPGANDDGTLTYGNKIFLSYANVDALEKALKSGDFSKYSAEVLFVIITILHEYVHSGDLQIDGKHRKQGDGWNDADLGTEFELETFGFNTNKTEHAAELLKPDNCVEKNPQDNTSQFDAFWQTVQGLPTGNYKVDDKGNIVPVTN